jgi:hypothetical protein
MRCWEGTPTRCCTTHGSLGPPWTKDHRTALAATILAL